MSEIVFWQSIWEQISRTLNAPTNSIMETSRTTCHQTSGLIFWQSIWDQMSRTLNTTNSIIEISRTTCHLDVGDHFLAVNLGPNITNSEHLHQTRFIKMSRTACHHTLEIIFWQSIWDQASQNLKATNWHLRQVESSKCHEPRAT